MGSVRLMTQVPGPRSLSLLADRVAYVPRGVSNANPIFARRAEGALVEDVDGNVFIDFAGGIGVQNVGHNAPELVHAIQEQAGDLLHTCFHVVMYEEYVALAKKLAEITPGSFKKKTVLVNSGAEAVENAVKIARKYTGRPGVITLENAFHGRTLLGMTLTAKQNPYKQGFGPEAPAVHRIPSAYCYRCAFGQSYPSCGLRCAENLDRVLKTDVDPATIAAIIVEPVQGEGGFVVPPAEFVPALAEIARQHGILLIADEVQTGFARTGKMFAVEHWGLEPDIVIMGKSLGGGLPIAAVTARAEIIDSVHVGGLGGTYGGNPVAAAGALKVIELMERENYCGKALAVGTAVEAAFRGFQEKYACVGDVRALGAMVALELVTDKASRTPDAGLTARVVKTAYENGLILMKAGTYNNVIRFLAPLTVTPEQLDEGLTILEASIAKASADIAAENQGRSNG
jgi:4-aminobutyrate aminotransferase/(S)-3-amino-2-methylpropionate transaminase